MNEKLPYGPGDEHCSGNTSFLAILYVVEHKTRSHLAPKSSDFEPVMCLKRNVLAEMSGFSTHFGLRYDGLVVASSLVLGDAISRWIPGLSSLCENRRFYRIRARPQSCRVQPSLPSALESVG
jgi:hypothetical protein